MKFLLALLILPVFVRAQTPPPQITPPPVAETYRWLYEKLIPEAVRVAMPNESFKSFWVHLLDSNQNFPQPEDVQARNLKVISKVAGTLRFIVVRKKYNYDVIQNADGSLTLNVRVYLKDPVGQDVANFRQKIQAAQDKWNNERVKMDFDYNFKFEITEDPAQALYSVAVVDSTRGPYDVVWGRDWSSTTIAHELGHMLGLGDEYQTFTSISDCLDDSLMCSSSNGHLMPQHFYFILRRFVQASAQPNP
jgi:hypothetical protein